MDKIRKDLANMSEKDRASKISVIIKLTKHRNYSKIMTLFFKEKCSYVTSKFIHIS
jgi:hypothetical protein